LAGAWRYISSTLRVVLLSTLMFGAMIWIVDIYYPVDMHATKELSRVITDRDDKWLYTQTNKKEKWRFGVDISKLDPLYVESLINFEDKRFWSHWGVDPIAMIRAIGQLIRYRHIVSGGSTITMQLAKLLDPKPRTISSKLAEIIVAIQLELHYSKREILEAYLTLAPYGGNIEGIVAASMRYFGKQPSALSPDEVALLVSLPKSPESNRPDRHPQKAKRARDRVLDIIYHNSILTKRQYTDAKSSPIPRTLKPLPRYTPHLSQRLLSILDNKNYIIKTTLDYNIQKQLERWAYSQSNKLPKGSTISLLIAKNSDSSILAYLGSHNMFDQKISGYIDMIPVLRSPGSTLKPFIYGLAFEKLLIHPNSVIVDEQTLFGDYMPHNYNRKFLGEVTASYALQHSLNIPAVKLLQAVGVDELIDRLTSVSGKLEIPKGKRTLPIALGGLGISMWQLAQLYIALANDGRAYKLHLSQGDTTLLPRLMSKKASQMTTSILRTIPPPLGYRDSNQQIAYKTGTSYGYRDFWTILYTVDYTIVAWVGRANNTPQLKHSGVEIAAPLAFEAIDILHSIRGATLWSEQPSSLLGVAPDGLKYFDHKSRSNKSPLKIIYPKSGARYQSAGCYNSDVEILIENGTPPYYWYIDKSIQAIKYKKTTISLPYGAHDITILDSNGDIATTYVWIDKPDCDR